MTRMQVAQVAKPNAGLEVVERDIPDPKPRQVRIKVQACGICHSDMFTVAGDRNLSIGESRRGLSAHDQWQGEVSGGADTLSTDLDR